jgi:hypothetical protein
VPEAAPVPAGVTWERFVARAREHAERVVERDGRFGLTTGLALFTCR